MKNQYFGDVNDFRKYGLLRELCGLRELSGPTNLNLGVCWMLTDLDESSDGKFRRYLDEPDAYRRCDPELFDWLKNVGNDKDVTRIEQSGLFRCARFLSNQLEDDKQSRTDYFAKCADTFHSCELVFFDPDNGIEVRSIPKGRQHSCKYVYWDELKQSFTAGASVLVYQHFIRESREKFINRVCAQIGCHLAPDGLFVFKTPNVLFILAAQRKHVSGFRASVDNLKQRWSDPSHPSKSQIEARVHTIAGQSAHS
jgi:hypothetical protein